MEQTERDKQLLAARDEIVKWCRETIIPRLKRISNREQITIEFGKTLHSLYTGDYPEYKFNVSSGYLIDTHNNQGQISIAVVKYQSYCIDAWPDSGVWLFGSAVYGAVQYWDDIKTKLLQEVEKLETSENKLANFKA